MLIGMHFTHLITNRTNPLIMVAKVSPDAVIRPTLDI